MDPPSNRKRPPSPKTKYPIYLRDCSGPLYVSCATLSCATANYCVPCAYKIGCFDCSLDIQFCKKIPNQRADSCKRLVDDGPLGYSRVLGFGEPDQKVLTVGDGDFSFSLAVARLGSKVVATSLETKDVLSKVYAKNKVIETLKSLESLNATVAYMVNAINLQGTLPDDVRNDKFDRIVWNFPCSVEEYGRDAQNREMERNKQLLRAFATNAVKMLKQDGQIHISHKTKPPFNQWNVVETMMHDQQLDYIGRIVVDRALFIPYVPRKALDRKSFPHHDACTYVFAAKAQSHTQSTILSSGMKIMISTVDTLEPIASLDPANTIIRVTPELVESLRSRYMILQFPLSKQKATKKSRKAKSKEEES